MPSKGFSFNFPNGIIELKLRRPVGKSNRQFSIDIKKDVKKLQKLREVFKHSEMHRRQTQFWMIVFDKKEDLQFDLSEADKEWLFFKYEFANQMRGTSLA